MDLFLSPFVTLPNNNSPPAPIFPLKKKYKRWRERLRRMSASSITEPLVTRTDDGDFFGRLFIYRKPTIWRGWKDFFFVFIFFPFPQFLFFGTLRIVVVVQRHSPQLFPTMTMPTTQWPTFQRSIRLIEISRQTAAPVGLVICIRWKT